MTITETKICGYCKEDLPVTMFHKKPTSGKYPKDGFQWACKSCSNKKRNEYRRKNPHILKNEKLRATFGISLDEYKSKLIQQRGVCAICGQPETALGRTGKIKMMSVDHNHETNQIRGLLCDSCNHMIGNAHEDVSVLDSAIRYLVFWKNI